MSFFLGSEHIGGLEDSLDKDWQPYEDEHAPPQPHYRRRRSSNAFLHEFAPRSSNAFLHMRAPTPSMTRLRETGQNPDSSSRREQGTLQRTEFDNYSYLRPDRAHHWMSNRQVIGKDHPSVTVRSDHSRSHWTIHETNLPLRSYRPSISTGHPDDSYSDAFRRHSINLRLDRSSRPPQARTVNALSKLYQNAELADRRLWLANRHLWLANRHLRLANRHLRLGNRPIRLVIRPLRLANRPLRLANRPLWLAIRPLWLAIRPLWPANQPLWFLRNKLLQPSRLEIDPYQWASSAIGTLLKWSQGLLPLGPHEDLFLDMSDRYSWRADLIRRYAQHVNDYHALLQGMSRTDPGQMSELDSAGAFGGSAALMLPRLRRRIQDMQILMQYHYRLMSAFCCFSEVGIFEDPAFVALTGELYAVLEGVEVLMRAKNLSGELSRAVTPEFKAEVKGLSWADIVARDTTAPLEEQIAEVKANRTRLRRVKSWETGQQ